MALSVAVNIVLDPIFIFGFRANLLFALIDLESLQAWLYAATGFTGYGVQGLQSRPSSRAPGHYSGRRVAVHRPPGALTRRSPTCAWNWGR